MAEIPVPPSHGPLGSRGAQNAKQAQNAKLSNGRTIQQARTALPLGQTVDAESLGTFGIMRGQLSKKERGKAKEGAEEREAVEQSSEDIRPEKIKRVEEEAKEMAKKNHEFEASKLVQLHHSIRPDDSPEDILRKVLMIYRDPTLADDTLAFLERVSKGDLKTKATAARALLNRDKGREIAAGRNIQKPVHSFVREHPETKQKPNALRQLYREITSREWTPNLLFEALFAKFPFEHLVFIFGFLFDALGTDLKATGPSVPKAQLIKLVKDTKNIQAIFGVYRYFKSTEKMLAKEFKRYNLPYPPTENPAA